MKIRWTLYGYEMVNDTYRIVPAEASVVRKIFNLYVKGDSLNSIAGDLTTKRITYFEDKKTWNKNMVSRILENENYYGNDNYPAIIEKSLFDASKVKRNVLGGKREADSDEIKFYKQHTFCAQCGKPYRRISKFGKREKWFCSDGCKYQHYIDDLWLFGGVTDLLNEIIKSPDMLKEEHIELPPIDDIVAVRKTNEVNRMIDKNGIQFAPVKQAIFDCVSSKFDCCKLNISSAYTELLKSYLSQQNEVKEFIAELFLLLIMRVEVNADSSIDVTFANGQTFRTKTED